MFIHLMFQYLPSPSRVLSFMDPLLHMGVVIRCAAAYTGAKLDDELAAKGTLSKEGNPPHNGHKSLYEYVDEVQKAQKQSFFDFEDAVFDDVKDNKVFEESVAQEKENGKPRLSESSEITPLAKRTLSVSSISKINYDYLYVYIFQAKKRTLSQSLADTAVVAAGHAFDTVSDWFESPRTPIGVNDKPKLNRAANLTPQMAAKVQQEVCGFSLLDKCNYLIFKEAREQETNFSSLLKLDLPRDPLISPMYASDELLRKLPPFWFIVSTYISYCLSCLNDQCFQGCHLDPLLDDTIMFARKVRAAGGHVRRVDLLDYIPHGFLNFTLVSPDCREGSLLVVSRIGEAFGTVNKQQ